MQLKWTDLAVADLDKIEAYITKDNSAQVGIDVVLRVIDTVEMILPDHPNAGRIGRIKNTRELVIESIPFTVIYRHSEASQIQVLRVLHDAQQWPASSK